jgi:ABC-type uncharacterized transport system permease subunit
VILSPKAAVYAGIKSDVYDGLCLRIIWLTLLISGGLASVCEVLGPIGQFCPSISPGYGYTAIIAAFNWALNPLGIILLQIKLGLPLALAGMLQDILFFFLLAADILIDNRSRVRQYGDKGAEEQR